jgi:hypothetical protein
MERGNPTLPLRSSFVVGFGDGGGLRWRRRAVTTPTRKRESGRCTSTASTGGPVRRRMRR